ncbi:hypothetical protein E4N80_05745 [Treponema denticola]|uniref:hypothetical protein n=1 Tax=Treponema denticola TaxID=158 RepID=UPI0020A30FE3|nr:hypothetical protein [Treponema denticola]UTD05009.1 hypothetical protein E4N80_05745 [Treponema denticola]
MKIIFFNSRKAELYKQSHKKNTPYILDASTFPEFIANSIYGKSLLPSYPKAFFNSLKKTKYSDSFLLPLYFIVKGDSMLCFFKRRTKEL